MEDFGTLAVTKCVLERKGTLPIFRYPCLLPVNSQPSSVIRYPLSVSSFG